MHDDNHVSPKRLGNRGAAEKTKSYRLAQVRRTVMNRLRRRAGRPKMVSRVVITAAFMLQLAFALAGPFAGNFSEAWSTPTGIAEEKALAAR